MESKTKKATKKTTVKKEVIKNEEVIVKNQIDYTNALNKIFYALIVIAVILGLNLIINVVTNADTISTSNGETEEVAEYDISEFETLTTTDAAKKIEEGGTQVVYIGRENCGYCVQFIPVLKQAQKDLGYKTIYIDLNEVTVDDQEKLVAYDSYVEENFGYTPMVLVFKDGKYADGWVGYTEIEEFKSFLADAGIK